MSATAETGRLPPDRRKIRTIERAYAVEQRIVDTDSGVERLGRTVQRQFLRYHFFPPPIWKMLLKTVFKTARMKPSFASLGAVRSGTSLLSDYILQHPCVVLPLGKEAATQDIPLMSHIVSQFPSLKDKERVERRFGQAIAGFYSPILPHLGFPYLWRALTDSPKMIVLLRDPVERTFSHWRWDFAVLKQFSKDPLWEHVPGFSTLLRLEIEAIESKGTGMSPISGMRCGGYLQHSIYLPFIKKLYEFFGDANILIINSSDFFSDPVSVAKQIYRFLGLPAYEPVALAVKNAGPPGSLDDDLRTAMSEFFRPLNEQLYEFLDRDFGWS